jgi:Ca2+/Na+ antiporter
VAGKFDLSISNKSLGNCKLYHGAGVFAHTSMNTVHNSGKFACVFAIVVVVLLFAFLLLVGVFAHTPMNTAHNSGRFNHACSLLLTIAFIFLRACLRTHVDKHGSQLG